MASGVRIKGVNETTYALERLGQRTNEAMLKIAREGSEAIAKSARLNAPVDTGDLEGAIEVKAEPTGINRRIVFIIGIDESKIINRHEAGYYVKVHEHLPQLGPKSKLKNMAVRAMATEEYVGDQYLTRAVDQHTYEIKDKIAKAVKELIK